MYFFRDRCQFERVFIINIINLVEADVLWNVERTGSSLLGDSDSEDDSATAGYNDTCQVHKDE